MKYVNETVRRQDRLLSEERALQLIRDSEYGVLSMVDADGGAYGLPLNYVWDGEHSLYIHCAPEGKKLRALAHNQDASFCIVGHTNLLPSRFTTEYESVVMKNMMDLEMKKEQEIKNMVTILEQIDLPDIILLTRDANTLLMRQKEAEAQEQRVR